MSRIHFWLVSLCKTGDQVNKLFWSISDKFTPSKYYITSLLRCFGNTVSLNLTKTPGPSRCPHWGPPIFTISIKSEIRQESLFGMNNHLVRNLTRTTTRLQLRSDHNGTILISFEYYSQKSTNLLWYRQISNWCRY